MKQLGLTILELIVALIIISILGIILIATFSDSSSETYDSTLDSVTNSLTTASATNYRIYRSGSPNYIKITDCTDIADTNNSLRYGQFKSDGYVITPSDTTINPGEKSLCIVTAPDGSTENFITIGTS